ncbi:hypothetical protein B0H17DRAFT_1143598 [Mycena rosella]|uniref:Uncharacterized protein n=1 Tax=Mycena rosella TaxID=1033263 RepID=A0AAD7G6J7_MYCRO|nr:hypothetical protein B0H17DRAFT_1143598 [Mycena rosella]
MPSAADYIGSSLNQKVQIPWKRPPSGPGVAVLVRKCAESRYLGARDRVCMVLRQIQGAIRCTFQAQIKWFNFQSNLGPGRVFWSKMIKTGPKWKKKLPAPYVPQTAVKNG